MAHPLPTKDEIDHAHAEYCKLTGQSIRLQPDREFAWFSLLKGGFTVSDVASVVRYLQREIRAGRRNAGSLKLSNLLQLDRFEEDLGLSRIRLSTAPPGKQPAPPVVLDADEQERRRQFALAEIRRFRESENR